MSGTQLGVFQDRLDLWNKGTSINISSTTRESKSQQGKVSEFFLLDNLKSVL